MTKTSATALAGQGLMGVARDNYGRDGSSKSYVAGFAEVEVDVETGKYQVLDFLAVADVGMVTRDPPAAYCERLTRQIRYCFLTRRERPCRGFR